jgi:hypothetical protein
LTAQRYGERMNCASEDWKKDASPYLLPSHKIK